MKRREKGTGGEPKNWALQGNQGHENIRGKHTFKLVHRVMAQLDFPLGLGKIGPTNELRPRTVA